jgi:hypothetical protein
LIDREVAVTFEGWLKDRPYAHQVPPMTKLWMEDAWQAALRRAAEIAAEHVDACIKYGDHEKARSAATIVDMLTREADRG